MKNLCFFVLFLMSLIGFGQKTIKDNGVIVSEERKLTPYNQVVSNANLDVVLIEGEVGKIKIKASENVLPYILTEVKNEILTIGLKPDNWYQFKHQVLVYVPVNQSLNKISLIGSGDLSLDFPLNVSQLDCVLKGSGDANLNLIGKDLTLFLSGSGDIKLKGSAQDIKAEVQGSGDIEAKNFNTETATIRVSGSGEVSLSVQKEVNASVSGSGDITIYGNPQKRNRHISGSGDIEFK